MSTPTRYLEIESSRVIDAAPADIYAVIADYNVGHQAILPRKYFTELVVEKGGTGAGTVTRLTMKVMGKEFKYHQIVSEPESGRVIKEADMDTPQYSTFTFDPVNGGKQTRVTINIFHPQSAGIMGFLEKLTTPPLTRRILDQELQNLADYMQSKSA
jgi:Polyketide cyclase / dehydrase and lipid transport